MLQNETGFTDVRHCQIEAVCTEGVRAINNRAWLQPEKRVRVLKVGRPSATFPTSILVEDPEDPTHVSSLLLNQQVTMTPEALRMLQLIVPNFRG